MIKVIASDLDGTLLNEKHVLSVETINMVRTACAKGMRFVIVTGRNYKSARSVCKILAPNISEYIVNSGAEIRNKEGVLLEKKILLPAQVFEVYERLKNFPISLGFTTASKEYLVHHDSNTEKRFKERMKALYLSMGENAFEQEEGYKEILEERKQIDNVDQILRQDVYKMHVFVDEDFDRKALYSVLEGISDMAISYSIEICMEITHIEAQKGPVLLRYIEALGYRKEEILVLGDSNNDYSMMTMDFGATVAMGNAEESIKMAAEYITETNKEQGAAYAIGELLEGDLKNLRK